jgi:hypothetical protein
MNAMNPYRIVLKQGRPVIRLLWSRREWNIFLLSLLWSIVVTLASITAYEEWVPWFAARYVAITTPAPAQIVVWPVSSDLRSNLIEWIQARSRKDVSTPVAGLIVDQTFEQCVEKQVDPYVMLALIAVESEFDANAQSTAGAMGLTQIIPSWHTKHRVNPVNVFDIRNNVRVGTAILAEYLGWHQGNLERALLQYNGSLNIPNSGYARRVLVARDELKQYATQTQIRKTVVNSNNQ